MGSDGRGGVRLRRALAATLAGIALATAAAACGGGTEAASAAEEPQAMVLQPGDVAVVRTDSLAGGVVLTGSLNPYRVVEVRAQVPGIVTRLGADRGDAVREGQTLAVIEAEGIRSAAAGARAQVAAAESNLALARQRAESSRTLYEQGALSSIDLQAAEAALEAARSQVAAARSQLAGATESARHATVASPLSGRVSERTVSQGEAVSPGQTLMTVVDASQLELAGQVPVGDAARVRAGQEVRFAIESYPGREFRGTVSRVEPVADALTRQVGVYLRMPNPDGLLGGLFASGTVRTDAAATALVVPEGAIRGSAQEPYVWLVEDGRAIRRPVVTGIRDRGRGLVQVTSGLQAGQTVVSAPGDLEDRQPVTVAPAVGRTSADSSAAPVTDGERGAEARHE